MRKAVNFFYSLRVASCYRYVQKSLYKLGQYILKTSEKQVLGLITDVYNLCTCTMHSELHWYAVPLNFSGVDCNIQSQGFSILWTQHYSTCN